MSSLKLDTATRRLVLTGGVAVTCSAIAPASAMAASAAQLDKAGRETLHELYAANSKARELGDHCRGVLVFPKIRKAGLVVGGQTGDGVLLSRGKTEGYYNISAVSYGLQAGAQSFSYALFLNTQAALDQLHTSQGWQVGAGPSVVIVDSGMAKTLNTTTLKQDVYAVVFGQKGLMGGLGLEGSKITQIRPGA